MGIDVGTTGAKVLLVDALGNVVAMRTEEYPLYTPRSGWTEQNPSDWWLAVKMAVAYFKSLGVSGEDVEGIGLTGQMHGLVMLDRDGEIVRPAILWNDQRTAGQAARIGERIGLKQVIEITGSLPHTGFTAPKLLWVRDNEPQKYAQMWKFLLPKDYVGFKLTGEVVTDVNDASGTSLFDVRKRTWSQTMLEALDISPEVLPTAMESPFVRGEVTSAAADEIGLSKGIPVAAGAGDQGAGGIGAGAINEGIASVNIGTSGVVFSSSESYKYDALGRLHSFCHAVPGKWHVMGVMLSAGGSLRWFRDALGEPERSVALLTGEDVYDFLTKEAQSAPPGSEGLIFLPYLSGERTPHGDPNARGVFFGLSLNHRKAHIIRSVLEGVAFGLKDSTEIMKEIGIAINEFRVVGGGSKSPLWRQILAGVFDHAVYTMAVDEGSSYGAAILASVAAGGYKSVGEAVRQAVSIGEAIEPLEEGKASYAKSYELFRRLYPALRPLFQEANG
ncbi:MAG: xylulokinase [Thermoprotei archaeon]